jgi:hypothetical protein
METAISPGANNMNSTYSVVSCQILDGIVSALIRDSNTISKTMADICHTGIPVEMKYYDDS